MVKTTKVKPFKFKKLIFEIFNEQEYGYDLRTNTFHYGSYEIKQELIKGIIGGNQQFEGYRCVAYHITNSGKETKISDRLFITSHDGEETVQKHFEQQVLLKHKTLIEPYLLNE